MLTPLPRDPATALSAPRQRATGRQAGHCPEQRLEHPVDRPLDRRLAHPPERISESPPARASRRLADIVYEQLFRLIARGEFPRDCKLPPEDDLSKRFGVSRPVIRDALSRLKDEGHVRSQRGSGTIVVTGEAPGQRAFPSIRTIGDLLRSYEFRITVETATAAIAAERRSASGLATIEQALRAAAEALDSAAWLLMADLNFAFHRAVARATQNPFYVTTLEMMPNFVGADRLTPANFAGEDLPECMNRLHAEHTSIFEAIAERDPARARAEMERHIAAARDFVLEQQEFTGGRHPQLALS